ncbi:MAG: hypothetical protein KatS3mg059_0149 [Thermomicrobiales bacterium]|nr:MAG: hypothetical protein KatS3mg059_0149 [Thermomicrobiales bacterium]
MRKTRNQGRPATPGASGQELEWRRESLARRLEDGYRRIDQAIAAGEDVAEWERFWIRLLREYEAICDTLQKAA